MRTAVAFKPSLSLKKKRANAAHCPTRRVEKRRKDTERSVLPGIPKSAICVQKLDDSLNSAIRITYRISLRSSSLREPRYPLLRVVSCLY